MQFTLWTDDPALAAAAARAGVARIGPDFETFGKRERQPNGDNRIADHHASALPSLRAVIGQARLHVRSNPLHRGLAQELDACIDAGVTSVMVPMVRSVDTARKVIAMVRGRAEIIVMVEHADALPIADELAALEGVAELYVGANDLARSLGYPTRFNVLGSALIETVAESAHRHGRGFGFFGIARPDDASLPVPADLVYAEQVRLGATNFVLARSFGATQENIAEGLDRARARLATWRSCTESERAMAMKALRRRCAAVLPNQSTARFQWPLTQT
jgi:2-keto-3-deoxy-L-rhamnonate aldolase RhmA